MAGITAGMLVAAAVGGMAAGVVAAWDAVAASPELQVLVVVCLLLTLIRGAVNGRVRKARYR